MNMNNSNHGLMLPPPGYKFIPRSDKVCDRPGCFECYDIYCQRCESKDRRILELEMRNNEMAKYIAYLNGQMFPRGQEDHAATEASGRGPAVPIIHDPKGQVSYTSSATLNQSAGISRGRGGSK